MRSEKAGFHSEQIKQIVKRLFMVVVSTAIAVFFSEKAYWYPQGFVISELILFYAFPIYACFWAIEHFRVRRLSELVLVAALFAFLVEGVITPVIYEAGLFDPLMPAYFIGWHGLLSIIFGWYLLRKWLIKGQWQRILAGSAVFGLIWGVWSITYWLPEIMAEWESVAVAGESISGSTVWTVPEFGLYAFVFSLLLIVGHWLLGRGGWQPQFILSKGEKWVITIVHGLFFATLVLPVVPLATFKLAAMLGVLFFALHINRRRESNGTIFTDLVGSVNSVHLLGILAMPLMATAVYAIATFFPPSETTLRSLLEDIPLLQSFFGVVVFLWAFVRLLKPQSTFMAQKIYQ